MNQLIDTIPTRRSKEDDVQKYLEWSRTAKTMQKRREWRKVAERTKNGVRPFPNDIEPVYTKFKRLADDGMYHRQIAERFGLPEWVVDGFMRRERMNDMSIEKLRKVKQQLNEDNK